MEHTPSELEFHQVFERITDAYVALDKDWRYTYLNAKACEFFGRRAEDLLGRDIWTEFPEGVGEAFHRACEQAMAEHDTEIAAIAHRRSVRSNATTITIGNAPSA